MTHTSEFLARCFGNYMPCKITDIYAEGVHYDMVGVSQYEANIQVAMPSGDSDWWNVDICKMLLTPLIYITDEDAIAVCKIGGQDRSDDAYKIAQGKMLVADYWNRQTNVDARRWAEIIDYLRSKGYDCGYAHIPSLINAGIAIDKTKA